MENAELDRRAVPGRPQTLWDVEVLEREIQIVAWDAAHRKGNPRHVPQASTRLASVLARFTGDRESAQSWAELIVLTLYAGAKLAQEGTAADVALVRAQIAEVIQDVLSTVAMAVFATSADLAASACVRSTANFPRKG